jgi:ZIP family zinc transporter
MGNSVSFLAMADDGGVGMVVLQAVVAGLAASVACGLGALPLFIPKLDPKRHIGIGYGLAGGLMFSASVYSLLGPALKMNQFSFQDMSFADVGPVIAGLLVGAAFLSISEVRLERYQDRHADASFSGWGGRVGLLVFLAMTVHSMPEGIAVGTGYTAGEVETALGEGDLGTYVALAIGIHNIPEGLAVAIPLRSAGAKLWWCFLAAFLTSLPQPVAAVPAVLLSWFFQPLMPFLMGFAAGAMIFLVIMEIIPAALESDTHAHIAWAFTAGFCGMLLIQTVL